MDQKVQRYFLEIKNKKNFNPAVCGIYNLSIAEQGKEDPQFCKFLYQKIGEDFHWKDRLAWSIDDWAEITKLAEEKEAKVEAVKEFETHLNDITAD